VLYFYPKDVTGGCTTQACELRDNIFAFRKENAVILGVSVDDVASHEKFAKEHSLPFDILADPTREVSGKYGVLFSADESYLCVGVQTLTPGPVSDYTGQQIYYRSIQHDDGEKHDRLTVHDYLWRWDTDWFWCSRAFGAQDPRIRRLWPRRYRRSSFYWKLLGYDQRFNIADRIEKRNGRPARERVVQDVELPIERTAEFLDWFLDNVPIEPLWLCPLRLRDGSTIELH